MEPNVTDHDDPASGARRDFSDAMSYGDYLKLDRILDAQAPLSTAHDEMLFVIQHQTSELWMKLVVHELRGAMAAIRADRLQPAFKMLTRVARIFEQLNSAWDVLRTMTPSEYTEFRGSLGQSSGFQSWQYRAIEFLLGNRNTATLAVHARSAQWLASMASTTNLHPDFGGSPYGFPFNVVDRTHATVSVTTSKIRPRYDQITAPISSTIVTRFTSSLPPPASTPLAMKTIVSVLATV